MPSAQVKRKTSKKNKPILWGLFIASFIAIGILSFPAFFSFQIKQEGSIAHPKPFPVSVNPKQETIVENPEAEALFIDEDAAASATSMRAKGIFGEIASLVASIPGYELLGTAGIRFVTIYPGYRQEEAARAFSKALGWNKDEEAAFLARANQMAPDVSEGRFAPGTYVVNDKKDIDTLGSALDERFYDTVLARYSTSTAAVVPLNQALTIASLLERETSDSDEMRIISGIIWNRIWNKMNLQIDATLQYAKSSANKGKNDVWWPKIVPKDKYIKSSYNTYLNPGLPPTPIANPSVAAVIAALNPKKTDCLFYFHDKHGDFHCSATYKEHVALLTKYYGQGK